jgi:hypothetical protein
LGRLFFSDFASAETKAKAANTTVIHLDFILNLFGVGVDKEPFFL